MGIDLIDAHVLDKHVSNKLTMKGPVRFRPKFGSILPILVKERDGIMPLFSSSLPYSDMSRADCLQVLPAYADDLTLEDPSSRIIAIKLLGACSDASCNTPAFKLIQTDNNFL